MSSNAIILAVLGGTLIGGAASGLLLFTGRIAGISGIVAGLLPPRSGDVGWRVSFVLGLLAGGVLLLQLAPQSFDDAPRPSSTLLIVAGLLVGVGTRIGNGCTSGHGVCGLSRRSPRSLAATATFMAIGMLTVWIVAHVLGRAWW